MTPLHHATALIPTGDGDEIEVELAFTVTPGRWLPNQPEERASIDVQSIEATNVCDARLLTSDLLEGNAEAIVAACWSALSDHHETNEIDRAEAMADARAEREMGL